MFLIPILVATTPVAAAPARFDAVRFFTGRTRGEGRLKIAMRSARDVRVGSFGEVGRDGTLTLRQTIREEGKPPRERVWSMRQAPDGRIDGTLTDATGPVVGRAVGNTLTFDYDAKAGYGVRQVLTLSPDGRTAQNAMSIRKFGVVFATLDETIRKLD